MNATILPQVNSPISPDQELISLLASYRLLPRVLFELIVDQAIADFDCTDQEAEPAYQQFCQQNQITEELALQIWLAQNAMTSEQLKAFVVRKLKIEKFKQATWGSKIESHFYSHKTQFDKVVYSLIQTQGEVAYELYFRIQEGESSFAELASLYSQGPEAENGGLIGAVELGSCPPFLAKILATSQPGQLLAPIAYGKTYLLLRLEKYISAQLDAAMSQRIMGEFFATWLQQQYEQRYDSLQLSLKPLN